MVTLEGLLEAYYDCRVRKSRTNNCICFTVNMESQLCEMVEAINNRRYSPRSSICFVVTRPKFREVFAADFADRIVHHYLRLRLEPLMEAMFNDRTYNCRQGKGTLAGVRQLEKDIRECSENYTKDCWVCKVDIKSFFMSISKLEVERLVTDFVNKYYFGDDKNDVLYLCHVILSHCPEKNCTKQSSENMWSYLPKSKSLFTCGEGNGMPIGNLPSQMFANYLLNDVDWAIENEGGIPLHGRYVDDIYLVDEDKEKILKTIPIIREKLKKHGLTLSHDKFYLQHYSKGVTFTGTVVKPGRTYAMNRQVESFKYSIICLNKCRHRREVERELFRVNSYLGVMRQADSYAIRREILGTIKPHIFHWCYIKGHFEAVILKKRYRREEQIKYRCVRGWDYPLRLPKPIMEGGERCDDKYIRRIENYEPTKFNI